MLGFKVGFKSADPPIHTSCSKRRAHSVLFGSTWNFSVLSLRQILLSGLYAIFVIFT